MNTFKVITSDFNATDHLHTYYIFTAAIPKCFICNKSAEVACKRCAAELNKDGYFCSTCSEQFHTHPNRKDHVLNQNIGSGIEGSPLDLLSVICIEISHFVCFTKEPSEDPNKPHKWIFFDSMANRVCKLAVVVEGGGGVGGKGIP